MDDLGQQMLRRFIILLLVLICSPAAALDELVDSMWLKANKASNDLILLDIQNQTHYRWLHIAGAINAPYKKWRTNKQSKKPGMLPPIKQMEQFLGELGINNENTVVIIAGGNRPGDMAAASRVFWTLKILGHQKVAILNGGLVDYAANFSSDVETINRSRPTTGYKANPNYSILATSKNILAALQDNALLLDARTLGEYVGVITARPNERPGTIPGAKHLPFDWMVNDRGHIRNRNEITTLFNSVGLNPHKDGTIHFCHSGNRAALNWFVDYAVLGNRNAKLYDASMSEWAVDQTLPIQTRIKFPLKSKNPP